MRLVRLSLGESVTYTDGYPKTQAQKVANSVNIINLCGNLNREWNWYFSRKTGKSKKTKVNTK